MPTQIAMAQLISDLSEIEMKIENQQIIPIEMLITIRTAKQIAVAFELLNISAGMQ